MGRFTDEEVDEILRRAIERQREDAGRLSHDDLVAAAGEIGIEAKDIDAAIAEVRSSKPAKARRDAPAVRKEDGSDEALLADDARSRRARFIRHLATYLVVNAFLAGINLLTGGSWWFLWVVMGWGVGVALQGVGLALPDDPQRRGKRLRRLRKRRDHDLRRAESKRREKEFERAVEEGVGLLLSAAASKIGEAVERHRVKEERREGGVRVQVDGEDDRVRVEVPDEVAAGSEPMGGSGEASKRRDRG